MNWLREVAHVARKDVSEERWMLASYAGAIVLAVARGMGPSTTILGVLEVLPLIVVLIGMVVVASVMQGDSPTRVDVFWATCPLRPLSVLSAKLALSFGAVLIAGALGQFFALRIAGATSLAALVLGAQAARTFGLCLILALVIGAVTRELKTFVLATIGLTVGFAIWLILIISDALSYVLGWIDWKVEVLAVVAAVAFLARLYYRRESGWMRWPGAIAVTGVTFAALAWPRGPSDATTVAPLTPTPALPMHLETPGGSRDGLELTLFAVVDSVPADDAQLALTEGTFIVTLRSGEKLRLPLRMTPVVNLSDPAVRLAEMRELRPDTHSSIRRYGLVAPLLPQQRDQLQRGIAGVVLEGTISVREPRAIGSLPLKPGARVSFPNGTAELVHVQMQGDLSLTVHRRQVGIPAKPLPVGLVGFDVPIYVLGNTTRRELVRLQPRSSSSGLGWGVLPGGGLTQGTVQLQSLPIYMQTVQPDDAWLRDARLFILDWTSLGAYKVHATIDAASLARISFPAPRTSPSAN